MATTMIEVKIHSVEKHDQTYQFKVTFIYRKFINIYTNKFILIIRDAIDIYINIYIYISEII